MNIIYLTDDLKIDKDSTKFDFYCDVETLAYNKEIASEENIKQQKNIVYSFAVSYILNETLYVSVFPSVDDYLKKLKKKLVNKHTGKIKNKIKVRLIFHNGNRYDNHFLLYDLKYYYAMENFNMYIKQAINNRNTVKGKDLKDNMILEKRIKTKNNLEMTFKWENITFITCDTVIKTSSSVDGLGKKLFKANLLEEKYLKTSFDYSIFDRDEDMTDDEARNYALRCFNQLTEDQIVYIKNDVIILAFAVHYYSTIYPSFDFEKFSLTSNIAEKFTSTPLAMFQMLNKIERTDKDIHVKYTNYRIGDMNLYEYFKRAYNGGSNFYNQDYLNTMIEGKIYGLDINHSYPYGMDNFLIPTFLKYANTFDQYTVVKVKLQEQKFCIYEVDKIYFNHILRKIKSNLIRRIIVKYYNNKYDHVYINTNTIRLINLFIDDPIEEMECIRLTEFDCVEFGNKEFLRENYYIKQKGSFNYHLEFNGDPYHYTVDKNIPNSHTLSSEEIAIAKTYNNGGYGFPALKPFFNLFRMESDNETYFNELNGFKNTERNIVFSLFVTSVAFYNLLEPLSHLEPDLIDTDVYYGDTDSLYMSEIAFKNIPKSYFDNYRLGAWGIDVVASKMFILNHKKYSLELVEKTSKPDYVINDKEIKIISGGIAKIKVFQLNRFRKEYKGKIYVIKKFKTYEEFIEKSFSHNVHLGVDKTVMNYQGVLTFYKAKTKLKKGDLYADYFSKFLTKMIQRLTDKIKTDLEENGMEDIIYIESKIGSFGIVDIFKPTFPYEDKKDVSKLVSYTHFLRDML